jgi:TPR repeat protein
MYANEPGLVDHRQAAEWFREAAEQGEPEAMFELGAAHFTATGVNRDAVEAYKWFSLSVALGSDAPEERRKRFADRLDTTAIRMTPEQVAEGQRRAAEWLAAFKARAK